MTQGINKERSDVKNIFEDIIGIDKLEDEQYIAAYGYPFYPERLKGFFA